MEKWSEKRQFGNKGEEIATKFLISNGFEIKERNFLRKYGEIDIVARSKDNVFHFIEVKSVSRESTDGDKKDEFRPEDNITPEKIRSLSRVIQVYIEEKKLDDFDWVFSIITVKIDEKNKVARVKFIEDIVL